MRLRSTDFALPVLLAAGLVTGCATAPTTDTALLNTPEAQHALAQGAAPDDVARAYAALGDKADAFTLSDVEREGRYLYFLATNDASERFACRVERGMQPSRVIMDVNVDMNYQDKDFYRCAPAGTEQAQALRASNTH